MEDQHVVEDLRVAETALPVHIISVPPAGAAFL